MKRVIAGVVVSAGLLLGSCRSFLYPEMVPYDNFKTSPNSNMNRSIQELPRAKGVEAWLGYRYLSNGHMEVRHGSDMKCVYIFEVDPQTRRMVGWRFEFKEKESDCVE